MAKRLAAGSQVRVGFAVSGVTYYADLSQAVAVDDMTGCLYDTGQFEWVEPKVIPGGFFGKDYFQVDAITASDFRDYEDFGSLVQQLLGLCAPYIKIDRRDPVVIDAEPEATRNDPSVAHVNATDLARPDPRVPPSKCSWSQMSFGDYLGCQLGIDKKSAAVVGVIGGVLVTLVVLKALKS